MNKPLIRAAAVINIAVASLIYIACSGEDGKDGKDGCVLTQTAAGYDVACPGQPVFTIPSGGGGGDCDTEEFSTPAPGGVVLTCGGKSVTIRNGYNGEPGGPGSGCVTTSEAAPPAPQGVTLNGDKVIQIMCADGNQASILVCPQVGNNPSATGLLFNTDGQRGYCNNTGVIVRSEQATLNCGGVMFNPLRQFCQRTLEIDLPSTPTNDSGLFATFSTAGLSTSNYPLSETGIISPESAYNLAGNQPGVLSRVLPLCGVDPESKLLTTVTQRHTPSTVYNALQYCGRNIVFKIGGTGTGNIATVKDGKTVPGGSLDNVPGTPFSAAWSVQTNGQCYVGLKETNVVEDNTFTPTKTLNYGINGYTFGGTSATASASATSNCQFFGIDPTATAIPYSACPAERPFVSLDNVNCVTQAECLYFSTIDNTCLISNQPGSLFGKDDYDQAYITSGTYTTNYVASFNKSGDNITRGIFRTKLGSRDGRGGTIAAAKVTLPRHGNMWSTACRTLRTDIPGFYAINDPYLTNKRWKEANIVAGTNLAASTPIPPPICAGTNLAGETVQAVALDDAFACVKGDLSIYSTSGTSVNDGAEWNRPIYCVQASELNGDWAGVGEAASSKRCYISSAEVASQYDCENITAVLFGTSNRKPATPGQGGYPLEWVSGASACRFNIELSTADATAFVTETTCETLTGVTIPNRTPVSLVSAAAPALAIDRAENTYYSLSGSWDNSICTITAETGAIDQVTCNSITRARQLSANEFPAKGNWTVSSSCTLAAEDGTSLESICRSLNLVRAYKVVPPPADQSKEVSAAGSVEIIN